MIISSKGEPEISNISVKPKTMGLFFVLLGIGLILLAIADTIYVVFYLSADEPLIEVILYTASDIAFYATSIVAWIVSASFMKTKTPTT